MNDIVIPLRSFNSEGSQLQLGLENESDVCTTRARDARLTVNVLASGLRENIFHDTANNFLNSSVSDRITRNDTTLGNGRDPFKAGLISANFGNEHAVWIAVELTSRYCCGASIQNTGRIDCIQIRVV